MARLLLGSGGLSTPERKYAWIQSLDSFLGNTQSILFIPYALKDYDAYVKKIEELNLHSGRNLRGIHTFSDPHQAIAEADSIFIGGGNSFRLLNTLYSHQLLKSIQDRVLRGVPYVGISAGTNMACPTIKTTNDMPIVSPPSLDALGFIPFQINPHFFPGAVYTQIGPENYLRYGGETREDRLREFHEMNDVPVLGIFEGGILHVEGNEAVLEGTAGAKLFRKGLPPESLEVGARLDPLLL